ncbi:hypothetical protein VE00_11134 [Pseudogymnoascus sp. WSF 3629]|nr:hypothetical protein VE00_11134 [Pseudogymnoascus sp. WSF 3629]
MADPLSATASIIAGASADRRNLIHEISSTRGILSTLNETVDDARVFDASVFDESWSATIRSLEDPNGPLNVLKTTLQSLATTLQGSAPATAIKKAVDSLRWPFKQSEVDKILRVIERQKSTLSLALENDHISLSREIRNNTEEIRDDVADLSRALAATRLDAKTDAELLKHNAILNQLPCADGAPFNAFRRDYARDCLPGTRVELLKEITTWGNTSNGPCIFWLSGMAGTGKSTIARTIARHFADEQRLGASFFFSRGQGDLGHAEKFFTTIASQIAHTMPTLKRHICEAVAEDHRVGSQGLREQWEKLVFRLLSKMENTLLQRLPIILVIDALDECEGEGHCILHHISKDVIERDISAFILFEFERIKKKRGLLSNWPKVEDISSISAIFTNYDEEDREEVLDPFKQTVGSIVILSDTLSKTALASLLGLQMDEVDEILKQLQAILDVPDALDLPVRLLHPSFRDFLLDKGRCNDLQFWIDEITDSLAIRATCSLTNPTYRRLKDHDTAARALNIMADAQDSNSGGYISSGEYNGVVQNAHIAKSGQVRVTEEITIAKSPALPGDLAIG